jgi:hypothetical protein
MDSLGLNERQGSSEDLAQARNELVREACKPYRDTNRKFINVKGIEGA